MKEPALTPRLLSDTISTMTRDQLARRIAEIAVLRGSFTLRSGRDGIRVQPQRPIKSAAERNGASVGSESRTER